MLVGTFEIDGVGLRQSCSDTCAGDPCQNGGSCRHFVELVTDGAGWRTAADDWSTADSYRCTCLSGFSGANCDSQVDECASVPCVNGGTCTDGTDSYVCACATHFSGENCDTEDLVQCTAGTSLQHSPTVCITQTYEICAFECDVGYEPSGTHTCGRDGTLSGGSCVASACTSGRTPEHFSTTCSGTTGTVCDFQCLPGYSETGQHTCGTNGAYSGGACVPISCPGNAIYQSPTICSGQYLDTCQYECNVGYSPSGEHTCRAGGVFTGGSCAANACTHNLRVLNSLAPEDCVGATGQECTFDCDVDRNKVGSHVCMASGYFSGGCCNVDGTCCGSVPNSDTVNSPCFGVAEGSECPFECDEGYEKSGTHVCGSSGTMDGGQCAPMACIRGTEIENSNKQGTDRCVGSVGDTCAYSCNAGYQESGTHVCEPNLGFSGGGCVLAHCTSGLTLSHSPTTCEGTGGELCDYICDSGYSVNGQHRCDGNSLAFTGGECTPNPCIAGNAIQNSPTTCTGSTGDRCAFECNAGYEVTGTHDCQPTGTFTGGSCVPIPCTSGLTITGSDVTCEGGTDAECPYDCRDGWDRGGSHICGPDTVFTGASCTPRPCADRKLQHFCARLHMCPA